MALVSPRSPRRPPPLIQRPSQMFMSYTKQAEYDEFHLEKQVLNKSQLLQNCFRRFEDCKSFLDDSTKKDEEHFGLLHMIIKDKIVDTFTTFDSVEERTVLGNKLARLRVVETLVEYYEFTMGVLKLRALTDTIVARRKDESGIRLLLIIRRLLWDYSDSCPNFTEHIADSGFFRTLMVDIHFIYGEELDTLEELIAGGHDVFVFCSAVSILYNCARNPYIEKERFRECGIVEKLIPFMKCKHPYIQMITLTALVNMVKEDQLHSVDIAETRAVDFLLEAINMAVQSKDRREHGFHLSELVDSLTAIAQNNKYKRLVTVNQTMHLMMKVLRSQNVTETLSVVKLLWELAFIPEARVKIKVHEELPEKFEDFRNHDNYDVQFAAKKAWFVIAEKEERVHQQRQIELSNSSDPRAQPHILFSYHLGDRKTVLEIYRVLRAEGYKIWIDVAENNKYSNVLEGMTRAIDGACVVLVCLSEKYKNSRNNRTELEYAFALKRPVVPLRVQQDYVPDGWLGGLIGDTPITIDFTRINPAPYQLKKLRETLRNYVYGNPPPLFLSQARAVSSAPSRAFSSAPSRQCSRVSRISSRALVFGPSTLQSVRKVLEWTSGEIEQWASDFKLEGRAYRTVAKMSGEQIYFVFQNWSKSPESFYTWAENTMRLGSIEDLMRFQNAIKALTSYVI